MKHYLLIFTFAFSLQMVFAQNMTNNILEDIMSINSDSIEGQNGRWKFTINETLFICLTDSVNNRMRIMSPIMESYKLTEELKTLSLSANFHTALDVKYAISDDLLWSIFIHPFRELSEAQLESAISQVYYANVNFGTSFASTSLVFPGRLPKPVEKKEKVVPKQKF